MNYPFFGCFLIGNDFFWPFFTAVNALQHKLNVYWQHFCIRIQLFNYCNILKPRLRNVFGCSQSDFELLLYTIELCSLFDLIKRLDKCVVSCCVKQCWCFYNQFKYFFKSQSKFIQYFQCKTYWCNCFPTVLYYYYYFVLHSVGVTPNVLPTYGKYFYGRRKHIDEKLAFKVHVLLLTL